MTFGLPSCCCGLSSVDMDGEGRFTEAGELWGLGFEGCGVEKAP